MCACAPGSPTRRPAGWPSSSSHLPDAATGGGGGPSGRMVGSWLSRRLRPAALPVRSARSACKPCARAHDGGVVDLSIGTPCDPPHRQRDRRAVDVEHRARLPTEHRVRRRLRHAIRAWIDRRFDIDVPLAQMAACIGTKEFVATTPQYLRLRTPSSDTVLYPAVAYPTYEMGAILAGCRGVPVACRADGGARPRRRSSAGRRGAGVDAVGQQPVEPHRRARPISARRQRGAAATACRCSATSATSSSPGTVRRSTILEPGLEGVVAVHSLSKRSNLAGLRVGFYAGDAEIVGYLKEVRKHVGMLVPGPAQAAGSRGARPTTRTWTCNATATAAGSSALARCCSAWSGVDVAFPAGGFYLWFDAGDGWEFAERLAREGGALVSPGDFYGAGGANNVRVAVVQPDDRIELVAQRLGVQ